MEDQDMSDTYSSIVTADDPATRTAALHVEIIADFVDPFCYLGKRRLETALQSVQGPSEVSWHPFQLNPEFPAEGMAFDDYLAQRFGSREAVQPVLDGLSAEGKHDNINFHFDRIRRVPNTKLAHLLMYLAETEGKDQSLLAEDIMAAFFEHGEDIGDSEVLVRIAARHGISGEAVLRVFDDETAKQLIMTREGQVRSSGFAGAPGFLLNRRLLMIGAQDADNMVNAFDRAMFGEGTDELVSPALH
jgi:predicted DsbA family dithiol-disulfide isomerase